MIDGYSYDATGNRLSAKIGGATQAYTYPTTNHRLSAVAGVARTYYKMGNTLTIGGKAREYLYDTTGRMTQVKRAGVAVMNYRYNGRGEQVRRYLGTTNTYTLYDEAGHWLGDYDTNGAPKQQAIWLDDLPVGLLANGGQLHYIEPDHLGSPRVVVDAARDVAVWSWSLKGEAFGNTAPNQDPDGDGTAMVFDMRFPGQRFDAASGFNQNYFRDYDAATGRYGQSDPIGLKAGVGTYVYVEGSPVSHVDPSGLCEDKPKEDCLDTALSTYSMEESVNSIVGFGAGSALFGGSAQVVNKSAIKPRGGVAGGGPSGRYTSYSRRYLGNGVGRAIGRLGIGTVVRRAGILGAGVGAITEHVEALNAFIKCRGTQ